LQLSSPPNFPLKSPNIIFIRYFRIWWSSCFSSTWTTVRRFPILFSIWACIFKILSHQRSRRSVCDIPSLKTSTLLNLDMIFWSIHYPALNWYSFFVHREFIILYGFSVTLAPSNHLYSILLILLKLSSVNMTYTASSHSNFQISWAFSFDSFQVIKVQDPVQQFVICWLYCGVKWLAPISNSENGIARLVGCLQVLIQCITSIMYPIYLKMSPTSQTWGHATPWRAMWKIPYTEIWKY
jgi:hypothetical protein